ncbi:Ubiquitin carboxyl-terminal hydrolase 17 [Euphorbia peplus]|nr:Ubiquitin carboxyl-terminal hydrolase 17 [Euphorbia peplus]
MLILGLQTLVLFFVSVFLVWLHHKWRNAVERKEEIKRLVDLVSKESAMVEFEAVYQYSSSSASKAHQCAVCFRPTTTRCSKCKAVHYCSGKCQIIHWRQGHREECGFLTTNMHLKQVNEFSERSLEKQSGLHVANESTIHVSPDKGLGCNSTDKSERPSENVASDLLTTRAGLEDMKEFKVPPSKSTKLVSSVNGVSTDTKLNKTRTSCSNEVVDCHAHFPNGNLIPGDIMSARLSHKKSIRRVASSEILVTDASKRRNSTSSSRLESVTADREDDSRLLKGKEARSSSFNASAHSQDYSNDLKNSVWRKVQQLRSKQSHNYETIFSYELFVKLYSCDEELRPFGLKNCGNSCYANTVLQCLAFTRPLTSYFVRGLHSNACQKRDWCFICEFEFLILKAREGQSSLSPIRILAKLQNIGSHLGNFREEDAHEFLRCAVDTMQSVCLGEAKAQGPCGEETTLVGLTFGGYLRSKITCMRCLSKSERFERIMDLTVEIDGNIETLEEALTKFTADEMLDGENEYCCNRCKSYVKAKKKLTILEAPNILTVVLKRFQARNFGKLNKSVRFPEILNMAPYMCGRSDRSARYGLYAVVVHRDRMSDASAGHYVCYIKTSRGQWFGINDSVVMPVELERVLLEEAYMLLYARNCPRAPVVPCSSEETHGAKPKRRNLEAVPSSLNSSKARHNLHSSSNDLPKTQQKNNKYPYWITPNDLTSNKLQESDRWRHHLVDSSSESSSLFSWSDASSCSTASTKDSVKSEDFSDFLFGEAGANWYSNSVLSEDARAPSTCRNWDAELYKRKDTRPR